MSERSAKSENVRFKGASPSQLKSASPSQPETVARIGDERKLESSEIAIQSDQSVAQPDAEGLMPQGHSVVAVPAEQVMDDPRDHGGAIIPGPHSGTYVPGLQVEASISAGTQSGTLTPNQNGVFPTVVIIPNGTAKVTLNYPELKEGDEIWLNCPDGGTVDGEPYLSRKLGKGGSLSFTWRGNDDLGEFTVTSLANSGADEKSLSFWSGPRGYADAAIVPR